MPLVSVFLPTYSRNSSGLLSSAIESVLSQIFTDFELLVIDDGSTDGSSDTIAEFCKRDSRVKHIRFEQNVGLPALTSAKAFLHSTGKFIAWQFDDCTWKSDHLSSLVQVALEQNEPCIVYGQADVKTIDGNMVFGESLTTSKLELRNVIPNVSTLIDRRIIDHIGWFDPSVILKRVCDYDFWIRASKNFKFIFINKSIAIEGGEILSDSLGNSVSLFRDLNLRVIKSNRNEYLKISNMDNWKPFEPYEWMNELDKEKLAYLTFEHFLRVKNIKEGTLRLFDIIGKPAKENNDESEMEAIIRYTNKTREFFLENDPLIVKYIRHAYEMISIYKFKGFVTVLMKTFNLVKRKLFR
jgi:glycosyltransferase involved in cell wall biosynthesis